MNSQIIALKNPDHLLIDVGLGQTAYACNQEWYPSKWKRMAGCGPSVASSVLLYLHRSGAIDLGAQAVDKSGCISLMETIWKYVTPTFKGVNSVSIFKKGIERFAQDRGFPLECHELDIPARRHDRPAFSQVLEFIERGLRSDTPVAFLNLSNGKVLNLDNWHWVTVVSLATGQEGGGGEAIVTVFDDSKSFPVDLRLWYETTTNGGGFVYCAPKRRLDA